jgi:hypothetical protein
MRIYKVIIHDLKYLRDGDHLEDPDVDGRIILK